MDQLNRQGLMVDAMVKTAALDDISSVNKQQYTKNIPAVRTIFGATVHIVYKIKQFKYTTIFHIPTKKRTFLNCPGPVCPVANNF